MGTSLGYGQGMEYQYFDAPQPSQPIPQLRQERLQQLREERMRRQQRRIKADTTNFDPRGGRGPIQPPGNVARPSSAPPFWGPQAPSRVVSGTLPPAVPDQAPVQMSPIISLPSRHLPAQTEQKKPSGLLAPAIEPAQDTGMIQRVRISRAALILTGAFVASRILGLVRTSMFAFVFGTSSTSDAYLQAFLIPDLIFNIVAGGALSSAFIPVFTRYIIGEQEEKTAWHIASSALNLAVAIMIGLALVAIIFARQLVPLYNPAIHDPKQLDLIATLTRIMLLQSIALGAGVIVSAVLNKSLNIK